MANLKKPVSERPVMRISSTLSFITPEARKKMISEKAYLYAEQRGFKGDCQLSDWLEAEAKVDRIYGKAK